MKTTQGQTRNKTAFSTLAKTPSENKRSTATHSYMNKTWMTETHAPKIHVCHTAEQTLPSTFYNSIQSRIEDIGSQISNLSKVSLKASRKHKRHKQKPDDDVVRPYYNNFLCYR